MNQEIKQKWCAALRSGEYKQGKNVLYDEQSNTYCCLGILADIYIKDQHLDASIKEVSNRGGNKGLSDNVLAWAGMPDAEPEVLTDYRIDETRNKEYLSGLNDIQNFNFEQIADVIEEHL